MAPPILKPKVNISLLKEDYFKEVWEDFSVLQVCKIFFSVVDIYMVPTFFAGTDDILSCGFFFR